MRSLEFLFFVLTLAASFPSNAADLDSSLSIKMDPTTSSDPTDQLADRIEIKIKKKDGEVSRLLPSVENQNPLFVEGLLGNTLEFEGKKTVKYMWTRTIDYSVSGTHGLKFSYDSGAERSSSRSWKLRLQRA
jgi:hypothetical protein